MSAAQREAQSALPAPAGPLIVAAAARGAGRPLQLSLVVPTYNESANLASLIGRLVQRLEPTLADRYEIIVVDDDSPDGTCAVALRLTLELPQLRVMRRERERGLATAVVRGWQAARGEVLGVIDADLQHPPELAPALYAEMERGADLAVASRYLGGAGGRAASGRRLRSRIAQALGLLLVPDVLGRVSDPMSGYFMVRRRAIQGIELTPRGYKILIEILARGRLRGISEVAYAFQKRLGGKSKDTGKVYLDYLLHLLRLRAAARVAPEADTRQASGIEVRDPVSEQLLVSRAAGVCELRFNRPEKRNAITLAMYQALCAALEEAQADEAVRAVLLSGEGAGFCAGNDLTDFLNSPPLSPEHPAMRFLRLLPTFAKPLLAAVHGQAIGIGVTLLLHCDLVVAARSAQFSLPFVALGIVPEAGSSLLLPRLVGTQRAAELLLLGKPFDATTAASLGLVNRVVEESALLAEARGLAAALARQPVGALSATRRLLRGDPGELLARIEEEARIFGAQLQSEEFRAGIRAFLAGGRAS